MTKVQSHVILILPNVTMELSNVRKKIKIPSNVTKLWSDVMLVLLNVTMEPLNVRKKKKKKTIKFDKRIITCNAETARYEDGTIKCDVLVTWYSRLSISGNCTQKKKKIRKNYL